MKDVTKVFNEWVKDSMSGISVLDLKLNDTNYILQRVSLNSFLLMTEDNPRGILDTMIGVERKVVALYELTTNSFLLLTPSRHEEVRVEELATAVGSKINSSMRNVAYNSINQPFEVLKYYITAELFSKETFSEVVNRLEVSKVNGFLKDTYSDTKNKLLRDRNGLVEIYEDVLPVLFDESVLVDKSNWVLEDYYVDLWIKTMHSEDKVLYDYALITDEAIQSTQAFNFFDHNKVDFMMNHLETVYPKLSMEFVELKKDISRFLVNLETLKSLYAIRNDEKAVESVYRSYEMAKKK